MPFALLFGLASQPSCEELDGWNGYWRLSWQGYLGCEIWWCRKTWWTQAGHAGWRGSKNDNQGFRSKGRRRDERDPKEQARHAAVGESYLKFYTASHPCARVGRSGKANATAYAANDVQGGIAVTSPPWIDAFCTNATRHKHSPENASDTSMYLPRVSKRNRLMRISSYILLYVTLRHWTMRYINARTDQTLRTLQNVSLKQLVPNEHVPPRKAWFHGFIIAHHKI